MAYVLRTRARRSGNHRARVPVRLGNWFTDIFLPGHEPDVPPGSDDLSAGMVRAYGIDPATGKFLSPGYAQAFKVRPDVSPVDRAAATPTAPDPRFLDSVRKAVKDQYQADYERNKAEADAKAFPWGAVVTGGVVVGAVYLLGKVITAAGNVARV
jgi:hypothetical protein